MFYCQQHRTPANRKAEFALHDAEWLACLAALLEKGYSYPHQELTEAWKLVCLNQFHDIIPGSSIAEVYEDSLRQYKTIKSTTNAIKTSALETLASTMKTGLIVANPTSFYRNDTALWKGKLQSNESLTTSEGTPLLMQETANGTLIEVGGIEE